MKHASTFALPFVLTMALLACTKKETQVQSPQNPPPNVLKSFSTDCSAKNCVQLKKSSLDKTFLLIVSGKTTEATPQWMDLKPMVVVFKKTSSQVGLFSININSIYDTEETQELVQSFDISEETVDTVTFDWGRGFETLREGPAIETEVKLEDNPTLESARIISSFLKSVAVNSDKIEIVQISKAQISKLVTRKKSPYDPKSETTQVLDTTESTFNLNIQLYPYVKNPHFEPKLADASKTVGFFVATTAKTGYGMKKEFRIAKWDLGGAKGPVRFLISANTPTDYVDAVKEGVLYWNKVLGFEAVTVETGADNSSVPPLNAVAVRWVSWEDAGFAYAQLQSDPMTGETLRGQVFMTPAWLQSKGRGEALAPVINPLSVCDFSNFDVGRVYGGVSGALAAGLSPNELPDNPLDLRIAQDRVRGVIAHEVGHVMGLRHNFAGSASVGISAKGVMQSLRNYLSDAADLGAMTSSTMMDYIRGGDEVLLGKFIQSSALPYDMMAMKWAYSSDAKDLDSKISRYCSDEDIQIALERNKVEIYECRRHDPAASPFLSLMDDQLKARAKLLKMKYLEIVNILFPADEPSFVNSLPRLLDENHADLQLKALKLQFSYLQSHEKVVSLEKWRNEIQRNFNSKVDTSLDAVLRDHLDQVGGLLNVKTILTPSPGWTEPQLSEMLTLIQVGAGKTKDGREYNLTEIQKSQFAAYFKAEAAYLEQQMQKELNEMFLGL
ncbi:MAG: zinc-dependent metalloprotease [Bdellovibrionaceae bacterium]|nr:zinc-dependent metalloprotease [Pseudobdellovibrionaceae bacterium]